MVLGAIDGHDVSRWLQPTYFLDFDTPTVAAFAADNHDPSADLREKAVALYYAVRDGIRYDPYHIDLTPAGFRASRALADGYAFCVPKAILLAAAARSVGIPARLGFGDVRNHLTTERLLELMKTDIFVFHGYADLLIDGRWIKATPAFNQSMCEKFNVKPLEFDGTSDSVFHEFDGSGRRHMEYVKDRGTYDDLPFDEIVATWHETIPNIQAFSSDKSLANSDFSMDAERERQG